MNCLALISFCGALLDKISHVVLKSLRVELFSAHLVVGSRVGSHLIYLVLKCLAEEVTDIEFVLFLFQYILIEVIDLNLSIALVVLKH